jgi:hypothetical protein
VRRLPSLLLLTCLLIAAAVAATPAGADSITYIKDGNVWLTSPDGARQYQVTFEGGWDSPSQADDGTLLALHGTALVRMDRSGHVLSTVPGLGGATSPVLGDQFKLYGPFDPQISPDGRRIAYWATAYDPWSTSTTTYTDFKDTVIVTASDHLDVERKSWTTSVKQPAWIDGDHLLLNGSGVGSDAFQTWIAGQGDDNLQWWFSYVNAIENDPELSPDGRKLVSVAQTDGALSAAATLHFFSIPGPAWTDPPYPDTWRPESPHPPAGTGRCQNVRDSEAANPSWSPGSDAIAYDDKDGVWVQQIPDIAQSCDGMTEKLLVPGAKHADWGPADVDMRQKPSPPSPAPAAGTGQPTGPAGTPAPPPVTTPKAATLTKLSVPASAKRRGGVALTVALSAPGRVTVTVCRRSHDRCHGTAARRAVDARAGTTKIVVAVKRLRRGRYAVVVQPPTGPAVVRAIRLR